MQSKLKTIGFPIMREEIGETRAFLPDFIQYLTKIGYEVFIEEGYGGGLKLSFNYYKQKNRLVHCMDRRGTFQQDYVLILRSPHDDELTWIGRDTCLISMLHFPTRSLRRKRMQELGIRAISLDAIVNDLGIRLVENMKAVGWNGMEHTFNEFDKKYPNLVRLDNRPWYVLILGSGMVGQHAMDAATKFGCHKRNKLHIESGGAGVLVRVIGRNICSNEDVITNLLKETDILVDATQREDSSKPIIYNKWLAFLPKEAIILDLAVDPYELDAEPLVVKGIEGIPQGNLDQYIFEADDVKWDQTVPAEIPSFNRRKTISCYSWPGLNPKTCMRHYAQQLQPLMRVLLRRNYDTLSLNGSYHERALYRARLDRYHEKNNK